MYKYVYETIGSGLNKALLFISPILDFTSCLNSANSLYLSLLPLGLSSFLQQKIQGFLCPLNYGPYKDLLSDG